MTSLQPPKLLLLLPLLGFFIFSFGFSINECQAQEIATADLNYNNPNSLEVIVNKKNPLPAKFRPNDLKYANDGQALRREAYLALQKMKRFAIKNGVLFKLNSAYRSYNNQLDVYNNWVKKDGQIKAENYSARPGYSEHQTGLALDLGNVDGSCNLKPCFAKTPAGRWLSANAHKYGFIIRYPNNKANITGYKYEPWHLRYVGPSLAEKLKVSNKTLEEYFNLPPAPSY